MTIFLKKILALNFLLLIAQVVAANADTPMVDAQDEEARKTLSRPHEEDTKKRRKPPSLIIEDPFDFFMEKLRTLNTSGKIVLWCEEISDYYNNSLFSEDYYTLPRLREKILRNGLPTGGERMVNRAFDFLILHGATKRLRTPLSFCPSPSLHVTFSPFPGLPMPCLLPGDMSPLPALVRTPMSPLAVTALDILSEKVQEERVQPVYAATRVVSAFFIKEHLQKFIAGQDEALASLSLIFHRFLCNGISLKMGQKISKPSHCILTGPSGCGKSETLRQIGSYLNIPILYINARSLTDEGYKGINFSEVVGNFYTVNNKPESAIVVLEEIDKLATTREDDSKFGPAIQKLLLSALDGNPVSTSVGTCDVSNWLFVGTGAFSMFDKGKRDKTKTTAITHADLKKAGLEKEFVGRFLSIIPLKRHTMATMLDVMTRENSPLEQIKSEFKRFYNTKLVLEDGVLKSLAEIGLKVDTGVRGLYTVLNKILEPYYEKAYCSMSDTAEAILQVKLSDIQKSLDDFALEESTEMENPIPFGMYT